MTGAPMCLNCRTWEQRYANLLALTKAQKKNRIVIDLDRKLQIAAAKIEELQGKYFDAVVKYDRAADEILKLKGVKT